MNTNVINSTSDAGNSVMVFESEDYCMTYPRKGKCYIFNHEYYENHTGLPPRRGTNVDAECLERLFQKLEFEVIRYNNLKVEEIRIILKKAGQEDYTDFSCIVCCILTHGNNGILYAKDGKYQSEHVFTRFCNEDSSLSGKPKLFFIQACRGFKTDPGVKVVCKESSDSGEEGPDSKIFTHPDYLIAFSTIPDHVSFKNKGGSCFIQTLCCILEEYGNLMNIFELLTLVNQTIAFDFRSNSKYKDKNKKKQMSCFTSTLTKNFRFL